MSCSVEDCLTPVKSLGLCQKHYFRMWRKGTLEARPVRKRREICIIDGCDKIDADPNGLCKKHLARLKRNGDPLVLKGGPKPRWGWENTAWMGFAVGYGAAHDRVARRLGPARNHQCVDCDQPAQQWAYNHDDPDELIGDVGYGQGLAYSAKVEHYSPRCISCHKRFDLRRLGKAV